MIVYKPILAAPDYAIKAIWTGYAEGESEYNIKLIHFDVEKVRNLVKYTNLAIERGQVVNVKRSHREYDDEEVFIGRVLGLELDALDGGAVLVTAKMRIDSEWQGGRVLGDRVWTSPEIWDEYPVLAPAGAGGKPEMHPVMTAVALVSEPALRDYGAAYLADDAALEDGEEVPASLMAAARAEKVQPEAVLTSLARSSRQAFGLVFDRPQETPPPPVLPRPKANKGESPMNYERMIEEARAEKTALQKRIDELTGEKTDLEAKVTELEKADEERAARLAELEGTVEKQRLQALGVYTPAEIDGLIEFRGKYPAAYEAHETEARKLAQERKPADERESAPAADHTAGADAEEDKAAAFASAYEKRVKEKHA